MHKLKSIPLSGDDVEPYIKSLSSENALYQSRIKVLETELLESVKQQMSLRVRNQELQSQNELYQIQLEDCKKSINDYEEQLKLKENNDKMKPSESSIHGSQSIISELEKSKMKLKCELDTAQLRITELEKQIKEINANNGTLQDPESPLRSAHGRISVLEAELAAYKLKIMESIVNNNNTCSVPNSTRSSAHEMIPETAGSRQSPSEIALLQEKLEIAQRRIAELEEIAVDRKNYMEVANKHIIQLEQQISLKDEKIAASDARLTSLKAFLAKKSSELMHANGSSNSSSGTNAAHGQSMITLQEESEEDSMTMDIAQALEIAVANANAMANLQSSAAKLTLAIPGDAHTSSEKSDVPLFSPAPPPLTNGHGRSSSPHLLHRKTKSGEQETSPPSALVNSNFSPPSAVHSMVSAQWGDLQQTPMHGSNIPSNGSFPGAYTSPQQQQQQQPQLVTVQRRTYSGSESSFRKKIEDTNLALQQVQNNRPQTDNPTSHNINTAAVSFPFTSPYQFGSSVSFRKTNSNHVNDDTNNNTDIDIGSMDSKESQEQRKALLQSNNTIYLSKQQEIYVLNESLSNLHKELSEAKSQKDMLKVSLMKWTRDFEIQYGRPPTLTDKEQNAFDAFSQYQNVSTS